MFWDRRNDNELPEELRGKKPEEIAAALRAAKDVEVAKTAAEAAKTAAEAALATKNTEFEQMKGRLTELEANANKGREKTPEEIEAERLALEPVSPWVDPQKFVQQETQRTTMVALAAGLMSAKMYFTQQLSQRDQKIFKKYEKDVEAVVNTFVPEQRVMPQSWLNAFLYIKGSHDQDIQKAESDKTDFFSETPTRGTPERHDEDNEKLTADEEEVCRRFHYDPKQYLARKKAGVLAQSEKGQYGRYAVETSK